MDHHHWVLYLLELPKRGLSAKRLHSKHTFLIAPAFAFGLLAAAGAAPLLLAELCSVHCSDTVTAAAMTDRLTLFPAQGEKQAQAC